MLANAVTVWKIAGSGETRWIHADRWYNYLKLLSHLQLLSLVMAPSLVPIDPTPVVEPLPRPTVVPFAHVELISEGPTYPQPLAFEQMSTLRQEALSPSRNASN
jgi:hypothetical protein